MLTLHLRHDLDHLRHDLTPRVGADLWMVSCQLLGITVFFGRILVDCCNLVTFVSWRHRRRTCSIEPSTLQNDRAAVIQTHDMEWSSCRWRQRFG
jgi:hypothetical protein